MKISPKQAIYIVAAIIILWLLYLARSAMMPFLLAAGFAYILNPLVAFLTHRVRLPRTLSVSLIYITLILALAAIITIVGGNLTTESEEFSKEAHSLVQQVNQQITTLPNWLQPIATDAFDSTRSSLSLSNGRVSTLLPGVLNKSLGILIFLVASFYFVKDGQNFIRGFLGILPKRISEELAIILTKINHVLGNYLRGQLLLMLIMATLTYIGLTIIGVRYALVISVFTGLLDILPYIGPMTAGTVAAMIAYTDQISRFNLEPTIEVLTIALLYVVLNQVEALFITPTVMGKLTKLHPLLVMFAVLAGGHLFGIVGFIIAVPIVASLRVVLEHLLSLPDTKKAP